jgi:Zn-dependent protease with chaperone function
MEAAGGQKPPELLSTHPSDAARIKKIEAELPEALTYYKPK